MSNQDWNAGHQVVGIHLNGNGIPDRDEFGGHIVDDSFLLVINAHHLQHTFVVPDKRYGQAWEVVVDTSDPLLAASRRRSVNPGGPLRVPARSTLVLQCNTDRRR